MPGTSPPSLKEGTILRACPLGQEFREVQPAEPASDRRTAARTATMPLAEAGCLVLDAPRALRALDELCSRSQHAPKPARRGSAKVKSEQNAQYRGNGRRARRQLVAYRTAATRVPPDEGGLRSVAGSLEPLGCRLFSWRDDPWFRPAGAQII